MTTGSAGCASISERWAEASQLRARARRAEAAGFRVELVPAKKLKAPWYDALGAAVVYLLIIVVVGGPIALNIYLRGVRVFGR